MFQQLPTFVRLDRGNTGENQWRFQVYDFFQPYCNKYTK